MQYMYIYVCVRERESVHVRLRVRVSVHVYIYIYICIYIRIYHICNVSEEKIGQVHALESNPGDFDLLFFCPSIKDLNHNPYHAAGSNPAPSVLLLSSLELSGTQSL